MKKAKCLTLLHVSDKKPLMQFAQQGTHAVELQWPEHLWNHVPDRGSSS